MGTIYFIQQSNGGPIKIGHTDGSSAECRIRQLQTANPYRLKSLLQIPGSIKDERTIQQRFESYRMHGEWFKPGPKLMEFIKEYNKNSDLFDKTPAYKFKYDKDEYLRDDQLSKILNVSKTQCIKLFETKQIESFYHNPYYYVTKFEVNRFINEHKMNTENVL